MSCISLQRLFRIIITGALLQIMTHGGTDLNVMISERLYHLETSGRFMSVSQGSACDFTEIPACIHLFIVILQGIHPSSLFELKRDLKNPGTLVKPFEVGTCT